MINRYFKSFSPGRWRGYFLRLTSFWNGAIYDFSQLVGEFWEEYCAFLARFTPSGIKRFFVEIADEATNALMIGLIILLSLMIPSFEAVESDWLSKEDYSVVFFDKNNKEIGKRGLLLNDSLELEDFPPHMIHALLATEDRRFYEHIGIDPIGIIRALIANLRAGGVVEGGSTLTQQLAKNLFLSNEKTLERKITEAFLSLWLEVNLTKDEILKLYLDRAYMGAGAYGVNAAANFYFNKPVQNLTLSEAAMLAGLFKAPSQYAPHINLSRSILRANAVLAKMLDTGFITQGQMLRALRNPASPHKRDNTPVPDYFLDYAFEELKKLAPKRNQVLFAYTTLDPNLQTIAEETVYSELRKSGEKYGVHQAAMVILENNGTLRAMVGGTDYDNSQFNRATDAKRQPGSAFKPFVYATAMAQGFSPKSIVLDAPVTSGGWPKNYTRSYAGPVNLTRALVKSINTVPVRLAQRTTRKKVIETAYAMGINTPLRSTLSLPLGTSEVTVLEMASAYAVFANGGYKASPFAIRQITTVEGKEIYNRETQRHNFRVLSEEVVAKMNEVMVQIPEWGTGRRAKLKNIRVGGKTGTTNDYIDGWFVGYTGNYTAAVWYGNDDNSPTNEMTGGSLPALTWKHVMQAAHDVVDLIPISGFEEDAEEFLKIAAQRKKSLARKFNPSTQEERLANPEDIANIHHLLETIKQEFIYEQKRTNEWLNEAKAGQPRLAVPLSWSEREVEFIPHSSIQGKSPASKEEVL